MQASVFLPDIAMYTILQIIKIDIQVSIIVCMWKPIFLKCIHIFCADIFVLKQL